MVTPRPGTPPSRAGRATAAAGRLAVALVLLTAVAACTPTVDGARNEETFTDPPAAEVDYAVRFGALAPLPPSAEVLALRRREGMDTSVAMTVRMPAGDVEPFLAASGMMPFDPYAFAPGRTIHGYWVSEAAPTTVFTRPLNVESRYVGRTGAVEPARPGMSLLHLWLINT